MTDLLLRLLPYDTPSRTNALTIDDIDPSADLRMLLPKHHPDKFSTLPPDVIRRRFNHLINRATTLVRIARTLTVHEITAREFPIAYCSLCKNALCFWYKYMCESCLAQKKRVCVKKSKVANDIGLFAAQTIPQNGWIGTARGKRITKSLPNARIMRVFGREWLLMDENRYDPARYIRYADNANCYKRYFDACGRICVDIVALREIKRGEEILLHASEDPGVITDSGYASSEASHHSASSSDESFSDELEILKTEIPREFARIRQDGLSIAEQLETAYFSIRDQLAADGINARAFEAAWARFYHKSLARSALDTGMLALTRRAAVPRDVPVIGRGVFVDESTVPNAGFGLFAQRRFSKGETITFYDGEVIDRDHAVQLRAMGKDTHIMKLADGFLIDGLRGERGISGRGGASFANHADDAPNAEVARIMFPGGTLLAVVLRAVEDIEAGQEVFIQYGAGYWANRGMARE